MDRKMFSLLAVILAALACSRASPSQIRFFTPTPMDTATAVSTYAPSETPSPSPSPELLIVKNETVYLRERPTQNSRVLDALEGGTIVLYAGECAVAPDMGLWVKVTYRQMTGWMSAMWLTGKMCQ